MSSVESKKLGWRRFNITNVPSIEHFWHNTLYVGIKGLSEYYKDEGIIRKAVRGFIFLIIAAVAIALALPLFIISNMFSVFTLVH
jgi:hypothetical protein